MQSKLRQTVLPFKLEMTEKEDQLTSLGGLPLLHELFRKMNLPRVIRRTLKLKTKGWKEWEIIEALIALVAAGGEHMDDMRILLSEKGYQKAIGKKGFPSAKAVGRFLKRFHDDKKCKRPKGEGSWVPVESKPLKGLNKVNRYIVKKLIEASGLTTVTIENDAMEVYSQKEGALGTYKGGVGYMPVIGAVAELGIVIGDEFRDGNVSPAFEVKRFFKECQKSLPKSVKKVRTRLDGAYYNHDLMNYLEKEKIDYTITAEKHAGFMRWIEAIPASEWKPLMKVTEKGLVPSGREWAQLDWVSANGTRKKMKKHTRRYLVTRKTQHQWELFCDRAVEGLKKSDRYEVIVTNMKWQGDRLIRWHYERAGSIEHMNDRIKNDVAGGVLPCGEFGANAAWWRIQCIALNLIRALQLHVLPEELSQCRLKRLRFLLFCIAGKVVKTGRQIILKLTNGHPSFAMYREARRLIASLEFT